MSVKITLTSHADAILQQLRENKRRALTAIGAEAVGAADEIAISAKALAEAWRALCAAEGGEGDED